MMKFGCIGCGICCTRIGLALSGKIQMPPAEADAIKDFPYAVQPDGSCSKLVDGKCSVYDKRPLVCSVERMYIKYYKPQNIPKKVYYNASAGACNTMLINANRDERVKLIE